MQLLMRRPEIRVFISVAPPANMYDFTFLAPCPSSGIIVQGGSDEVVTAGAVQKLVDKLRTQKHITIHHDEIPRANHFFEHEMDQLMKSVRSEEHTSELQSLMRISYAVFCLIKKRIRIKPLICSTTHS